MSSSNNSNNNNNRIPVNCGIYLKRGDAIDTNCCFIITMMCLLQHKVFESRDTFFDFIIFRTGNLTPSLKERITKESKPHKMISDDFIPIISRFFGIKITLVSDGISREIGDDDNKEHYYVFYENNHYQPMLSRSEVIERKEWINANKKMQETLENKLISNDDKYARSLDKSTSATATSTSTATVTATATATSTATSTVTSTLSSPVRLGISFVSSEGSSEVIFSCTTSFASSIFSDNFNNSSRYVFPLVSVRSPSSTSSKLPGSDTACDAINEDQGS